MPSLASPCRYVGAAIFHILRGEPGLNNASRISKLSSRGSVDKGSVHPRTKMRDSIHAPGPSESSAVSDRPFSRYPRPNDDDRDLVDRKEQRAIGESFSMFCL